MLESRSVRKCWVSVVSSWVEVHLAVTTRRNFTDQDITELIIALESDAHSSEDEDISA